MDIVVIGDNYVKKKITFIHKEYNNSQTVTVTHTYQFLVHSNEPANTVWGLTPCVKI